MQWWIRCLNLTDSVACLCCISFGVVFFVCLFCFDPVGLFHTPFSLSAHPTLRVTEGCGDCSLFRLSFSNGGLHPGPHPGQIASASCSHHQEFMLEWKWNHMEWGDRYSEYADLLFAVPVAPPLSSERNTFRVKTWWKEGRALSLLVFSCNLTYNHLRYTQ